MTALRAPFPWPGGKARWADIVRDRFGDVTVYVEPFAGSLAILLARPPAAREIVCDTDGMVVNFWRAMAADPEAVAQAADWPTFHDDLNARRKWLADWRDANAGRLVEDMDYHDAKAAGLWAWAVSNWIGSAGDMLSRGDTRPQVGTKIGGNGVQANRDDRTFHDKRPQVGKEIGGHGVQVNRDNRTLSDTIPRPGHPSSNGGEGVQVQKKNVPLQKNKVPKVTSTGGAGGVAAQRDDETLSDWIPYVRESGGRGVTAHRDNGTLHDKMPHVTSNPGGQGTQPQRLSDSSIPRVERTTGGRGTQAQRLSDWIPYVQLHPGGQGVTAQRRELTDGMPMVHDRTGGKGVSALRRELHDKRPHVHDHLAGAGVQPQRRNLSDGVWGDIDTTAPVGSGLRLLDWFLALQQRLARVIVLNRSWESAVTPTLLQHTPTAPKPPVGVVLDPPYRIDTGRTNNLYTGDEDATDVAVAAYAWAVEHGSVYRIAYFMHEGDFPIPDGWDAETLSLPHAREGALDMAIFSPACYRMQERLL